MPQAKALTRRWDAQTAPPDLAASGVPSSLWPTKPQFDLWWPFVKQPVVAVDGWFMAACPLHDPDGERPEATAEFMFRYGSFRCLADDDEPHDYQRAGKSAGTLNSLRSLVAPDDQFTQPHVDPEPDWDTPLTDEEQAAVDAERQQLEALRDKSWRRNAKVE